LAFGKGWGDFDIQMTLSEQFPVSGLAGGGNTATVNMTNFGDPFLWNTTFQYHFLQYFWPELEVNYEYWPNGEHQGLSQVCSHRVSYSAASKLGKTPQLGR
jgi:hypothetical protein